MDRRGKDNVQCIRAKTLPEVVMMPGAGERGARIKVVVMRPPHARNRQQTPVVIQMPSQAANGIEKIPVLEIPMPGEETSSPKEPGLGSNSMEFYDGILMAVCALLGWPGPTHGKDPGAAAARPWKVERLHAISRLRIPMAGFAQRAAYADEDVLARAA